MPAAGGQFCAPHLRSCHSPFFDQHTASSRGTGRLYVPRIDIGRHALFAVRNQAVAQLAHPRLRQCGQPAARGEDRVATDDVGGLAEIALCRHSRKAGIDVRAELVERVRSCLLRLHLGGAQVIFVQHRLRGVEFAVMVLQHRVVVRHDQQRRFELALQRGDVQPGAHVPQQSGAQFGRGRARHLEADIGLVARHRLSGHVVAFQVELGRRRRAAKPPAASASAAAIRNELMKPPRRTIHVILGGFTAGPNGF